VGAECCVWVLVHSCPLVTPRALIIPACLVFNPNRRSLQNAGLADPPRPPRFGSQLHDCGKRGVALFVEVCRRGERVQSRGRSHCTALVTFLLPNTTNTHPLQGLIAQLAEEKSQDPCKLFDYVWIDEARAVCALCALSRLSDPTSPHHTITPARSPPPAPHSSWPTHQAGQALPPEALIPMTLCKGACMLAGDPRQLGPAVRSASAALAGLSTPLLELLIDHQNRLMALGVQRKRVAAAVAAAAAAAAAAKVAAMAATAAADANAGGSAQGGEEEGSGEQQQQQQQQQTGQQAVQQLDEWAQHHAELPDTEVARLAGVLHLHYCMLTRNYRSHASLLELPSRLFYKQVRLLHPGDGWADWLTGLAAHRSGACGAVFKSETIYLPLSAPSTMPHG